MLHVAQLSPNLSFRQFSRATLAAALLAVGAVGCHRSADSTDRAPPGMPVALAAATLTDQDGEERRFSDFQGKAVVLSFFFASCPSVCPKETRALAEVQGRLSPALASRVQFVSITVDPNEDTPQKLNAFGRANGADLKRWSFMRATEAATKALTTELAVFNGPLQAQAAPVGHNTSVYLFDARGRLRQRYAGSPLDVARLAREIAQVDQLAAHEPELSKARL
jgi:cytochrome oxidase Cu insertion factor (SCO1/SenC/PrrC family)